MTTTVPMKYTLKIFIWWILWRTDMAKIIVLQITALQTAKMEIGAGVFLRESQQWKFQHHTSFPEENKEFFSLYSFVFSFSFHKSYEKMFFCPQMWGELKSLFSEFAHVYSSVPNHDTTLFPLCFTITTAVEYLHSPNCVHPLPAVCLHTFYRTDTVSISLKSIPSFSWISFTNWLI